MTKVVSNETVQARERYDTAMENRALLTSEIREKIRDVVNPYFDKRDSLLVELSEAKSQTGRGARGASALSTSRESERLNTELEFLRTSNPFALVAPETGLEPGVVAQLDRDMGVGAICIRMHQVSDGRISERPTRVYYISENQPDEVHEMDGDTFQLTRHEIGGERVSPFEPDADHADPDHYSREYAEAAQALLACAGAIEAQKVDTEG